jgi:predicted metal-binding membrane protein
VEFALLSGLAVLAAASWILMLRSAPAHAGHAGIAPGLLALSLMWVFMMAGMMVPATAPTLLAVARRGSGPREGMRTAGAFLAGDLLVWAAFSVAAALAQWKLHAAGLMGAGMATTSATLSGGLLLAAGAFQLTPVKAECLRRCRSPWTEGRGPFGMGVAHGALSAASCGGLMGILFVTGVMSLPWMAGLTAFLVLEKVASDGAWIRRVAGGLLVGWGAWWLLAAAAR